MLPGRGVVSENAVFFNLEVLCYRDVTDEARGGGAPFGGGGSEDGDGSRIGIEFKGDGRR